MESGEKELRQHFEETTTNNVKAILAHGNKTRALVREAEIKVLSMRDALNEYEKKIAMMQAQITNLQQKLYRGGTQ